MAAAKVTELDYFKSWIAFFLMATVGGMLAGAFVGGVLGFILGASGAHIEDFHGVFGIVGYAVAIPVSYICFRLCVDKFIVSKMAEPPIDLTPHSVV